METLEKLFSACFEGDICTPHPTKRQKHDKRKIISPQRKRNYFLVPQSQLSHLTGRNSSALQHPRGPPINLLLEIRSHYVQSRICEQLPDTASRENRQERIPAFISATWGVFLPEKQHGLGLLKAGQSQKLFQGSYTRKMQVPSCLFCSARGMKAITEIKLLPLAAHIRYKNRFTVLSESVPGAGIYQHTV